VTALRRAFRILFGRRGNLKLARDRLLASEAERGGPSAEVRELLDFIAETKRGVCFGAAGRAQRPRARSRSEDVPVRRSGRHAGVRSPGFPDTSSTAGRRSGLALSGLGATPGVGQSMEALKVIVVMPAYNAERTLERTLIDIAPGAADELILVDDASSDGTVRARRAARLERRPARAQSRLRRQPEDLLPHRAGAGRGHRRDAAPRLPVRTAD
jgi:hypothetical protein